MSGSQFVSARGILSVYFTGIYFNTFFVRFVAQGIKRPRRGVDRPSLSSVEVKERVELYLYSPSGLSSPVIS
jgi:hypothetical protein